MGHYHRFKRGDRVTIIWGRFKGATGVVDSAVFQRTVDYPEEYAAGYNVALELTGVRYTMGICRFVRSWNLWYKGLLLTKQAQSLSLASASAVLATTAILPLLTCTIACGSFSRLRYHAGWRGEPRYDAITTYESLSIK